MATPLRTSSPIRFLDDRSPPKKLPIIKQEDFIHDSMHRYYASYHSMQFPYHSTEAELLKNQLYIKDKQLEQSISNNIIKQEAYALQNQKVTYENELLRKELQMLNRNNQENIAHLRNKYIEMAAQDEQITKKTYYVDVNRLLKDLQLANELLKEKEIEIKHLTELNHINSQSYANDLESMIAENNVLRNQINFSEMNKNYEVKQAESKRQLEKSRTKGIIEFCKENNSYIEKEVTKLAEQLLQKNISIQTFTKELLKQRRNQQLTSRQYEADLQKTQDRFNKEIQDLNDTIRKIQKHYKQQIADQKTKQLQLLQKIASLEHQQQNLQRQLHHSNDSITLKDQQIQSLKQAMDQLRQQHSQEINKMMNESRLKRKSMKNISSLSSSSKEISYSDLVNQHKSPSLIVRKQSIEDNKMKFHQGLPIVHEQQLSKSQAMGDEGDHQVSQLINHYENMIKQIKNNKQVELTLANERIRKLQGSLTQKQKDFLQILEKFSPLMQLKVMIQKNEKPLQQLRNDKIKSHQKADLDLLSVLLDKYQIESLRKYKFK